MEEAKKEKGGEGTRRKRSLRPIKRRKKRRTRRRSKKEGESEERLKSGQGNEAE